MPHRVEQVRRTLCVHGNGGIAAFRYQLSAYLIPVTPTGTLYGSPSPTQNWAFSLSWS
jgi:hypothetical protein